MMSTTEAAVWPAQCQCGHIYQERYQFQSPTPEGYIGFCWCGWCRSKRMVRPLELPKISLDSPSS